MIFKNCNADFLILVPTFRLLRQPFFSRQDTPARSSSCGGLMLPQVLRSYLQAALTSLVIGAPRLSRPSAL